MEEQLLPTLQSVYINTFALVDAQRWLLPVKLQRISLCLFSVHSTVCFSRPFLNIGHFLFQFIQCLFLEVLQGKGAKENHHTTLKQRNWTKVSFLFSFFKQKSSFYCHVKSLIQNNSDILLNGKSTTKGGTKYLCKFPPQK